MNTIFVKDRGSSVKSNSSLVLEIDRESVTYLVEGKLACNRNFSSLLGTKMADLELFLFVLSILGENVEIDSLTIGTAKAIPLGLYLKKHIGIDYSLDSINFLPAKHWNVIFNSSGVTNCGDLLKKAYLPAEFKGDFSLDARFPDSKNEFRINIVAYYSAPFESVGTKRPEFMNDFFNEIDGVQSDILSSVPCLKSRHVYVPDFADERGENALDPRIKELEREGISIIGATWSREIRRYYDDLYRASGPDAMPNCVILSGNPFYYFDVAEYLKNRYGLKIVLDYRDPFANNPLMLRSSRVEQIQKEFEAHYNSNADIVVAVNSVCKELVELKDADSTRVIVVENGYDDGYYPETLSITDEATILGTAGVQFVYAGSFSKFRSGHEFAAAIEGSVHKLQYMGSDSSFGKDNPNVTNKGMVSGSTAAENILSSDVGIVFATGEPFESTTKIYDYIGAGLPILIVTNGECETGALHELTKDLDEVYWVKNEIKDIKSFLQNMSMEKTSRSSRQAFSRGSQTQILFNAIRELG